jgi:hypothetical protein
MDSTIQRIGLDGRRYLESSGTTGRWMGAAVLALAVAVAVVAIIQAILKALHRPSPIHRSAYSLLMLALVLWWSLCMVIAREEVHDLQSVFEIVAAIIIVIAAVASPPTLRTLSRLVHLMNIFAVASLAYAYLNPFQQLACRVDKCGLFGNLFSGFLFQENGAARFVVLLMPAAAVIKSKTYLALTFAIAGAYVAATGSRTSLLSLAIAVMLVIVVRRRVLGKSTAVTIPWPLRLAPFAGLGVSFYLLYEADSSAFTGRGEIYAGIREQLQGSGFIFGSGSDTVSGLRLAYNALAFGEHGEAPHLMVRAGIIGLILFAAGMLTIVRKNRWNAQEAIAFALLFVAATQFATEPAWELELRTMSFTLLVLTAGLLARGSTRNHPKAPKPMLPEWHRPGMLVRGK